jgi:DNA (cytosine-5)-methyltransferase 1
MKIGSLFSGIGGLEKGLEQAGVGHTVFQVELNDSARRVLTGHWPDVPRFVDVRDVGAHNLPAVDVLCGGPPCTDLSDAGSAWERPGLEGKRSGLVWEYLRVVTEMEPTYVVIENVDGAAWRRWVPSVRRALHTRGYASVPFRLRACDVGAPFKGSRVFLVATPHSHGQSTLAQYAKVAVLQELADACRKDWGKPSPTALGMAPGIPRKMDRLRLVGNAVVPACAEVIGRMLLMLDQEQQKW